MKVEHDKKYNLNKYIYFIKKAANKKARLLVFPECSLQGYTWSWNAEKKKYDKDEEQFRYFENESETIPGPTTDMLSEYAVKHNMFIQIGLAERFEEKNKSIFYNSIALIGPNGLIGVYRKIHMAENPVFTQGKSFTIFETNIGKIGPIICADLAYPESIRVLALKGAEIITMSTAWGMMGGIPKIDLKDRSWTYPGYYSGYKYDLLGRANALQNGVWLVMANQVSSPDRSEEECFGHSRIIDPSGRIVAGIGYEEGLVTASVDIGASTNPNRFRGRQPEYYKDIVENFD